MADKDERTGGTRKPGAIRTGEVSVESSSDEIHEVIFSKVIPGRHEEYRKWAVRMRTAQEKVPGYLGAYMEPPEEEDGFWTTILRFDSRRALDQWIHSPVRKELMAEAKQFLEVEHTSKVKSSFPGWFPKDPDTGQGPPNWKAALLVLLGLFPIVMLQIRFLSPVFTEMGLGPSPSTFLGNILSVGLTSFLTMPLFVRLFDWWLFPKHFPRRTTVIGLIVLVVLFAAEVYVFGLVVA